MDYRPNQYYVAKKVELPVAKGVESGFNVYFRNENGSLGQVAVASCASHKDAILEVKELLVQGGDCLTNKAVLAVI